MLLMLPNSLPSRYVFLISENSGLETYTMNPGMCSKLPSSDISKQTVIVREELWGAVKENLSQEENQFTAAAAEEPTPTDFSAPYSLLMCVLWYAYLKHNGIWLRDPQDWTKSNSLGASMF